MTDGSPKAIEAATDLDDGDELDSVGDGSTLDEVRRRLDNLDSGRTQAIPYDVVKRKLRATVDRARGSRAEGE